MLPKKVEEILNVRSTGKIILHNCTFPWPPGLKTRVLKVCPAGCMPRLKKKGLHMLKLVKYVNERDGLAVIPGIDTPPTQLSGTFSNCLTRCWPMRDISRVPSMKLLAVCIAENDFTTQSWIQWFVNEQIEEEASVKAIIDKLKLLGKNNLYMFDRDILSMRGEVVEKTGPV